MSDSESISRKSSYSIANVSILKVKDLSTIAETDREDEWQTSNPRPNLLKVPDTAGLLADPILESANPSAAPSRNDSIHESHRRSAESDISSDPNTMSLLSSGDLLPISRQTSNLNYILDLNRDLTREIHLNLDEIKSYSEDSLVKNLLLPELIDSDDYGLDETCRFRSISKHTNKFKFNLVSCLFNLKTCWLTCWFPCLTYGQLEIPRVVMC